MALVMIMFMLCLLGFSLFSTLASPSSIITEPVFRKFFPSNIANPFYTYNDFIAATKYYPTFGSTGSLDVQKRELAAYFANVKQETGTLQYIREINRNNVYCDTSRGIPCPAGTKAYYGRGPLQLTWNYNYDAAGKAFNMNLLQNPDQVAQNGVLSWRSSVWFWMQNSNCHTAITQNQGFGATIRAINGGQECGKGSETQPAQNRINYYKDFCSQLGVSPGGNLGCA
ncbi:chitinase 4 [Selaginella moellendorffii]|nr:chitinase 4 [Selaginella moellendorffii]|eukprot:XP_002991313.2 chitinase 4 [Selaginella moellendorffii]